MKKLTNQIICCLIALMLFGCTKDAAKQTIGNSGKGGSLARFTIVGNYLYVVDNSNLKVFDLSLSAKPQLKNTTEVGFEIETIFPFRDKLFIGSTSVIHIFSIENPERPEKLSTAVSPEVMRRCDPVVAKDTVAYATLRTNSACGGVMSRLAVYDIKDVLNPVQVNFIPITEPYGLAYADEALYVCDINTLHVYDISKAYQPEFKMDLDQEKYFDVIPYGNTLVCWTEKGITLYDITRRLQPELIAKIR